MKTTSLELSKQLKEAGFPQESSMWVLDHPNLEPEWLYVKEGRPESKWYIAAPTAEEILERLPWKLNFIKDLSHYLTIVHAFNEQWDIRYRTVRSYSNLEITDFEMKRFGTGVRPVTNGTPFWTGDASLAEAAGKMWLYLKENNLLKEEVGKDQ